jgi:hypothetical protein
LIKAFFRQSDPRSFLCSIPWEADYGFAGVKAILCGIKELEKPGEICMVCAALQRAWQSAIGSAHCLAALQTEYYAKN